MNNIFSLQQISRTNNLDAILKSRQNKLNRMADFLRMKFENTKLGQSQKANQLGYSTNTLQRYRKYINMPSPYRNQPYRTNKRTKKTSNTNFGNNSHRDLDDKRSHLTSNDLKTTSNESVENEEK